MTNGLCAVLSDDSLELKDDCVTCIVGGLTTPRGPCAELLAGLRHPYCEGLITPHGLCAKLNWMADSARNLIHSSWWSIADPSSIARGYQ